MRDAHASLKARSTLSTACTGMSVVGTVVWRCVDQPPLAAACASQLAIIAAHSCGSSKGTRELHTRSSPRRASSTASAASPPATLGTIWYARRRRLPLGST